MIERRYSRSASQIKKYLRCPKQYWYDRFEKMPQPPAAWTARGIGLHNAILKWEGAHREGNLVEFAAQKYQESIDEFKQEQPDLSLWTRTPRTKNTENDIKYRLEDVVKQATSYQEYCRSAPWSVLEIDDRPAVEVEFEMVLEKPVTDDTGWVSKETDGIRVRGSIDIILKWPNGKLSVRDVKTGSPKNDEFDPRQVKLYTVAARKEMGLQVDYADYYFTKVDRPSKLMKMDGDLEEEMTSTFFAVDDMIEAGHFPTNPSEATCGFCPYRKICPDGRLTV